MKRLWRWTGHRLRHIVFHRGFNDLPLGWGCWHCDRARWAGIEEDLASGRLTRAVLVQAMRETQTGPWAP